MIPLITESMQHSLRMSFIITPMFLGVCYLLAYLQTKHKKKLPKYSTSEKNGMLCFLAMFLIGVIIIIKCL